MKATILLRISSCLLVLFCATTIFAQKQTKLDLALRHIENNYQQWELTPADISDIVVNDNYYSKLSKVQRVIFKQRHNGIEIFEAVVNVGVSENGKTYNIGHRFISSAADKVNAVVPVISAEQALLAGLAHLDIDHKNEIKLKETISDQELLFEQTSYTNSDIRVKLVYQPLQDGKVLRLSWDMTIEQKGADYWGLRIDGIDGSLVHKNPLTIHCSFADDAYHRHTVACQETVQSVPVKEALTQQNKSMVAGAQYNVLALPVESPVHGNRSVVEDPANLAASPYGWHDTNASDGAEYTITRGNNVHAYIDAASTDGPNSNAPEPDGGAELHFDFPYNPDTEPGSYEDAATVNLFYVGNMMHDLCYAHGFDEQAGNFQFNNYGNGGSGNDYIRMESQDGSGVNNANYSGAGDGGQSRVQMFVWDRNVGGEKYVQVTAPANIAGDYPAIISGYGPSTISAPISADVVEVNDGVYNPYISDGCEPFLNGAELDGKIALVDRGGCYFVEKTMNAEANGAVAIIVCNFEDDALSMGDPGGYGTPSIPSISLGQPDCATIREFIGNGLQLTIGPPPLVGPNFLDGDFDNGIVCHEYGHGVSGRCVGGPNISCLGGDEQMGEGWSDFFSVVYTVQPGDGPETWRGVGTYVNRQPTTGKGIRSYPYSPDMSVNPLTYGDIGTQSIPHGVGAVWCTMLWDLYWAMVGEYGWSEDLYTGNAGNNMTIRLVIEGMKNLSCNPGFIDGRDAIMQADMDLYDGANQCLISKVFARRGLGINASQGSANSSTDGTENFDPIPTCIPELKITKSATPLIAPGGQVVYNIHIINHRPMTLTDVIVTDEIPDGLTYVNNSASVTPQNVTGDMISFDLGSMNYEDEITITYKANSDPAFKSDRLVFEDMDDGSDENWIIDNITGFNVWDLNQNDAFSGDYSWHAPSSAAENNQLLNYIPSFTVTGSQPVLRFYHRFNTQAGVDGGLVEISADGGTTWENPNTSMLRNGYTGLISYTTFVVPDLETFWGESNGWIGSYVDLSPYSGQEIFIRFRFGSDDMTSISGGGWFVDNVEFMNMFNYQSEACVTSDQGDNVCTLAPDIGTVVNPVQTVATHEVTSDLSASIFPNPANQVINISLDSKASKNVVVSVLSMDGKTLLQQALSASSGNQMISLDITPLVSGFYFVQITSEKGSIVEKIVIE